MAIRLRIWVFVGIIGGMVGRGYAQKLKPLTFKVMTYSIQNGINTQGKTNLLRIVELIKKHQPDLVALQAVDSGMVRSGKLNQLHILSLLTGYNEVFGAVQTYAQGKEGLGILSKFPIVATQLLPLPHIDTTTQRRALFCALLALPANRYCRFCNTELDDFSPLNRGLQAAVVNEALQYSIQPVLLAGAMNVQPEDHTLEAITKYWNDAGHGTDAGTYEVTGKRIDYVWTLKTSKFKLLDYRVLYEPFTSEHVPVLATYALRL